MFLGLRTIIYRVPDLAEAKAWFTELLGVPPYFDEDFYVGYDVAGYELGLQPVDHADSASMTYWGVPDVEAALERFVTIGGSVEEQPQEVGGGIRVAAARAPGGNVIGLIENPNFQLPAEPPDRSAGPGR